MSSSADAASAQHLPGPRDLEPFYKAQKRNRRATWRMSAVSTVAALIMGIPLTLVLTPVFYAATLFIADIIDYFSPLPREFWDNINGIGQLAMRIGDYVFNQRGTIDIPTLVLGVTVLLLPGMVITLGLWLAILAFFRRGGVGGALTTLNAREPNKSDLKELQLADVVEEMAIAAGIPAPKVMLVDSPGANAATIGTSHLDARLLISRRMLDELNRDQLQAVLAHLIASIGNGDLHVAFTVTSIFETCGLLVTLINAPWTRQSRSNLWRVLRYALRRGPANTADSAEAEAVAALLTGSLDPDQNDAGRRFDTKNQSFFSKVVTFAFFPFIFTNMVVEFTLWIFLSGALGPCMALLWRTRRYLADASAVQLNRNPNALADALRRLSQDSTTVMNGDWASHLFIMNPKGDRSLNHAQPDPERMQKAIQAWAATAQQGAAPAHQITPADFQRMRAELKVAEMAALHGDLAAAQRLAAFGKAVSGMKPEDVMNAPEPVMGVRAKPGTTGLQSKSMMSFHPSLKRRLRRLERMGAHWSPEAHGRRSVGLVITMTVLYMIIGPLLAIAAGMMLMVMAMMIMLNLVFLGIWMTVLQGIFSLLRH
jgi:Zn-dependent protease with chaperone function